MTVSETTLVHDDVLNLDSLLSPAELQLRSTVREFVNERIRPNIAGWYEAAHFPWNSSPNSGTLGSLGCICRATAARAAAQSNTVSPQWNWKQGIPDSGPSLAFRAPLL